MYDVNTKRIEQILTHMGRMLHMLRKLTDKKEQALAADEIAVLAMERALHLSIEAVVDVGNALIDGFIMRDPGSYTDIVEILRDEQVIDQAMAEQLTDVVSFRKQLILEYAQVPVEEMIKLVKRSLDQLDRFAPAVRQYIEQELF